MNDDRDDGRIVRDMGRYKLLFTNSKAEIADNTEINLGGGNTRALIGQRIRALKATLKAAAE